MRVELEGGHLVGYGTGIEQGNMLAADAGFWPGKWLGEAWPPHGARCAK